jgi:hypothetical protein
VPGLRYGLAAGYGAIALVAALQLVRIQMRVPEYGWTTQKVFHLLNFLVAGLRVVVFTTWAKVSHFHIQSSHCRAHDTVAFLSKALLEEHTGEPFAITSEYLLFRILNVHMQHATDGLPASVTTLRAPHVS